MHIDFLREEREQEGKEGAGTGKGKGRFTEEVECRGARKAGEPEGCGGNLEKKWQRRGLTRRRWYRQIMGHTGGAR